LDQLLTGRSMVLLAGAGETGAEPRKATLPSSWQDISTNEGGRPLVASGAGLKGLAIAALAH
jgi:hypothetical protein